jgi:hypothetical protein
LHDKLSIPSNNLYFSGIVEGLEQAEGNEITDFLLRQSVKISQGVTDIVFPSGTKQTLRNKIVHQDSVQELNDNLFAIYWLRNNNVVKFDASIMDDYPPVMECVFNIYNTIPESVIKILSCIINTESEVDLSVDFSFDLKWKNIFVNYNNYVVECGSPESTPINKFKIDEFNIVLGENFSVKSELFEHLF